MKRVVVEVATVLCPPFQDCNTLGQEVAVNFCYNTGLLEGTIALPTAAWFFLMDECDTQLFKSPFLGLFDILPYLSDLFLVFYTLGFVFIFSLRTMTEGIH